MTAAPPAAAARPGAWRSLLLAMTSWRTASVTLLSFASGLPYGIVVIAIPDWMRSIGVDIRVIGLITLAQAPWTFKVAWSPLMDRYLPPFLGRRRGWAVLSQVGLFACMLGLAGVGQHPETPWVVAALALAASLAASTQDIAVDAYAVDVLRPEEQGVVAGARIALYRAAMFVAGGWSITAAAQLSWPVVNFFMALLFLPMMVITALAPEPADAPRPPRSLRQALWHPFLGFLARHRALEILAFVFFYKIADNLGLSLLRPFLVDMGYGAVDRGVSLATVGLVATLAGAFLGGFFTTGLGLGHCLWIFGAVQIFSNLGYVLVARAGEVDRLLMYSAMTFEQLTGGLGTGAFSVLLLRMTQKRFSATQFALFSTLFGLPRILAGPISGFTVDAMGWESFFWFTIIAGIPGMVLLQRFSPLGVREPSFQVLPPASLEQLSPAALTRRGISGGLIGLIVAVATTALMGALRVMRREPDIGFAPGAALQRLLVPGDAAGWLTLLGFLLFAAAVGLCTAASVAARHGAAAGLEDDESGASSD